MLHQSHVVLGDCNTLCKVVILVISVLHLEEELQLHRFVSLLRSGGSRGGDIASQVELAEPRKNLLNAKTLALRADTRLHFLDKVLVVEPRIGQRLDLRNLFQRRFPPVKRRL